MEDLTTNPLFSGLKWEGTLVKTMECLAEIYQQKPSDDSQSEKEPWPSSFFTPYQFTLPIMQALYFQLIPEHEKKQFVEIYDTDLAAVTKGNLRAVNPERRGAALQTSLRAVAYYSWEPGSRLFLVRRVYPTYFDFLSVSYIPEGWGASSLMLTALNEDFARNKRVENGLFYGAFNMNESKFLRYNLPYIAEQKRLNYEWVVVVPVFRNKVVVHSDRDMLGTFVFFLSKVNKPMPVRDTPDELALRMHFNKLCVSMSNIVAAHNKLLVPSGLAELWKDARKNDARQAAVARVRLTCHKNCLEDRGCPKLDAAGSKFLQALEGPEYFVLRDEDTSGHEAIFLIVARPSIESLIFKKNLLQLITDRLADHNVKCDITIGDGIKDSAFSMESDHKW